MSRPARRTTAAHGTDLLPGTVGLGRVGGVPVRLHWSVLLIMALLAWALGGSAFPAAYPGRSGALYAIVGIAAAVVFLLCLFAHEVSHAIVARRHGVPVDSITLWLFGGVARLGGEAADPGAELRIAGVGPLVSLLLGLGFLGLGAVLEAAGVTGLLLGALSWLAWINILIAGFNVLPGAPLDGGRLLRAALWKWRGDRAWAAETAARAGRGRGMALIAIGVAEVLLYDAVSGLWMALIGWFIVGAAGTELQSTRVQTALAGVRVRDVMTASPDTAPPGISVGDLIDHYLFEHRHSTFPLVEAGRPVGLVTLARVKAVPAAERYRTPVLAIACPMAEVPVAAPDEPLVALLSRLGGAPDGRALVIEDGLVTGIVSPADIARAVDRATLTGARA
jgi:Zn-dependent protease